MTLFSFQDDIEIEDQDMQEEEFNNEKETNLSKGEIARYFKVEGDI